MTTKTVTLDDDRPFEDMPMDMLLALLMAVQHEALLRLDPDVPTPNECN